MSKGTPDSKSERMESYKKSLMVELGEILREKRLALKLSKVKMAKLIGVHHSQIYRWETQKWETKQAVPKSENVEKIIRGYELNEEEQNLLFKVVFGNLDKYRTGKKSNEVKSDINKANSNTNTQFAPKISAITLSSYPIIFFSSHNAKLNIGELPIDIIHPKGLRYMRQKIASKEMLQLTNPSLMLRADGLTIIGNGPPDPLLILLLEFKHKIKAVLSWPFFNAIKITFNNGIQIAAYVDPRERLDDCCFRNYTFSRDCEIEWVNSVPATFTGQWSQRMNPQGIHPGFFPFRIQLCACAQGVV